MTENSNNRPCCKAQQCNVTLSTVNRSGYCRSCFARFNGHPRLGRSRDSDVMRRVSLARLAWCPVDLLPAYRHLTRIKEIPAREARRIICRHMDLQIERRYGVAK